MRKIPMKNYAILCLIVVATVLVTVFLVIVYNNRHQKTSVLYDYLSEVTLDDLDTYLIENETAVIYIDNKYNKENEKIEKQLKNKIIKNNLKHQFVFLDTSLIDDNFIEGFNQKYNYQFKEEYPLIIVIKNKKVIKTYNKENVKSFDFGVLK